MLLRILFITLALMTTSIFAQTPPIEAGVSQTLAKWRAANYSDVRYKLNITLEKGAPLMKGDIEIRVKLTDEGAKNDLILDWRTTSFANDKDKPYANVVGVNDAPDVLTSTANEHIRIPHPLLKKGENVIKIQFASPIKTSGAAITRYVDKEDGAEYVYSLFVPSDASTAFPVFDQPDLKARFKLSLTFPNDWQATSNSEAGISKRPRCIKGQPCSHTWSFDETPPISTYVFAFAAGEFEAFTEKDPNFVASFTSILTSSRKNLINNLYGHRIYVRKSQVEKFKQHEKEIFRLNREAIKFLETYFDYKFPFSKYELVLIPEFPFGGMEHAGCTFLREDRVIFPTEPTKNDYITRANVIFHEAAHQWFGDTVTMRWFDDLWLKEGFAEFMAYKTLEKVMPEYNAWKIFYERNKQLAYLTDSTRGTTPIYQEIPNLSAAKSAYGNIVYRKAPSFLRQAEFYLGEDKFQIAVRAFLKKHEFANAEWTDLVKEFETASKQDLKDWANVWVKQRGMPAVKSYWSGYHRVSTGENSSSFSELIYLFQDPVLREKGGNWKMRLKILSIQENGKRQIKDAVLERDNAIAPVTEFVSTLPSENKKPAFVFLNYQDYGYGIFLLDEKSRAYVLENIQTEKDDFLRTMMWGSLWDSVREAELNPKDYVALVIKNLGVETDESTIQTLLGRVSTAMNYYLPDAQAKELAPQIENLLIDKMQNAPTLGLRITFYRAFLNIASTENARIILKEIYEKSYGVTKTRPATTTINGKIVNAANLTLPLKTKDRFDIVTKLLILGDVSALDMLHGLAETEQSDEANRYRYAAQAAYPAAAIKQRVFDQFINDKQISESYIESALTPFNSPRHADLTLPYLEKALAELPNLKRNRKIFFVNGWLAAFIGGQKSAEALAIVNKFLSENPNLDKDLRLKVLEASDGLERAVKIRNKFRDN